VEFANLRPVREHRYVVDEIPDDDVAAAVARGRADVGAPAQPHKAVQEAPDLLGCPLSGVQAAHIEGVQVSGTPALAATAMSSVIAP
jgi:hypothetical protein